MCWKRMHVMYGTQENLRHDSEGYKSKCQNSKQLQKQEYITICFILSPSCYIYGSHACSNVLLEVYNLIEKYEEWLAVLVGQIFNVLSPMALFPTELLTVM